MILQVRDNINYCKDTVTNTHTNINQKYILFDQKNKY